MLPDFGEIIFSVVVTYMGAIELFYVMKHLYHLAFQHEARGRLVHDDSLKELQKRIQNSIDDAAKNEIYGLKAMKDGVMYKDGFRVDPNDIDFSTIDRQVLGSSRNSLENITENYESPTEPVLEKKEYDYDERNLVEVCEEPCTKKIIAPLTPPVPKNIEPIQSTPLNTYTDTNTAESDEYNTRTTNGLNHTQTNRTVKTQLTQQYREEVEEPIIVKKSVDPLRSKTPTTFAEPVVSDSSVGASAEILESQSENATSIQNRSAVSEQAEAQRPITPVKQIGQNENLQQIVQSEQIASESNVSAQIKEEEAYQRPRTPVKYIEEQQQNLKQPEELQQLNRATTPIEELQQIKKAATPVEELQQFKKAATPIEELQQLKKATTPTEEESYHRPTTPIKQTEELQQFQKATAPIEEEFHHRPTTPIKQHEELHQPPQHNEKHDQQTIVPPQIEEPSETIITSERYEDSSSNDPLSSKQSSISNQKSSSLETSMSIPEIEMNFQEYEREAPEGQDMPEPQYSEEYLRSLDGLKYRPLVRDDGTKRRRAFKKRRSSNESTSSRESRASREEELKMFTSLEEEEFAAIKRGESDVVPIKYSSEPNLKIGKHHRRHKKSPMKDTKKIETEDSRSSLEMLNEEDTNPWGEVKPEHYKNTEFWQREKTISIEEESDDSPKTLKEHDGEEPQQAGELTVPSTPSKHMPHMSSFEEATESQHQCVVPQLQRRGSRDTEQNGTTKDNIEDTENVSNINQNNNVASLLNNPGSAAANNSQKSNIIEENAACNQTDEIPQQKTLRRSPRQDDMEKYEERLREAEMNAMQNQSPLMQSQANNELKNINTTTTTTQNLSKLTENFLITERNKSPVSDDNNIKKTFDDDNFTHLGITELKDTNDADNSSSSAGILDVEKDSLSYNIPKAPFIEIEHAPDDDTAAEQNAIPIQPHELEDDVDYDEVVERPANLMEGLSDFYDFNASINPSRSPSVERRSKKSKSPSAVRSSRSPFKSSQSSRPSVKTHFSPTVLEGLSDFYDFNVMLNKHVYGQKRSTEAHRTSVDYIVAELKNEKPKINTLPRSTASKNAGPSLYEEGGRSRHKFSPGTPTTPEYERRLSANLAYIERMQNEYRENQFKRSTYVGESMDFENDFEELREQTRHFQRSRSKSRSPEPGRPGYASTSRQAQRELQEKILDEITRTTINFQEFSRDMNQEFLDHERRGSDSAMIQRPEILFQIQDIQKPGTFNDYDSTLDEYEPEEYHHFRRFSLDQAYQIEEYPADEYDFIEQIEIKSERSWTNEEYYISEEHANFNETHKLTEISESEVSYDSSNHAEAEDFDTGSDDERQTVIEVDDENGEDIWNDDRANDHIENEIEFNEIQQDRYTDKEEHDWKEEGAVGGANIEDMYDDVMKNNEESGIEKDYNVIVEAIETDAHRKSARNSGNFDSVSIRTEDLLEEILREDDEKYNISPKIREQLEEKESSQRFITNEVHTETKISSTKISSTRLRSRYGLPPSTSYTDYDVSDLNVDLNYTPKKEYNWRKNFKLDDDDGDNVPKASEQSTEQEEEKDITAEVESDDIQPHISFLDPRKYSLGGESITLFSQSPYRCMSPERYDNETSENLEYTENFESTENSKVNDISEKEMQITQEIVESSEITFKKKKSKKKSRKGSTEETTGILVNTEETDEATTKKKTKKKKKVTLAEPISPDSQLKSPSPPKILSPTPTEPNSPTIILNTQPTNVPEKNITNPSIKTIEPPNSSTLRNPSITPEHIDERPQSKTPETVKSTGPKPEPSGTSSTLRDPSKITKRIDEERSKSKTPETVKSTEPKPEPSGTSRRPPLERNDSSGVYELIKDGSMYPWF